MDNLTLVGLDHGLPPLDGRDLDLAPPPRGGDGLDLAEFAWYDPETEDGCYRAWDYQWAIAGDTLVHTERGRQEIRSVKDGTRLLTYVGHQRGAWAAAAVQHRGEGEVCAVSVVRRGVRRTLHAASGHGWSQGLGRADRRIYVPARTDALQPGAWLEPVCSPAVRLELDRLWVQAGIVFGDGTMARNLSLVRLYGDKRALKAHFDRPATVYTGHEAKVGAEQVRGLPGWYKTRMPDVGVDSPGALWGWLAGYFATDGSVLPDGTCTLYSVRLDAMVCVREIATALGVVASDVKHRSRVGAAPGRAERITNEFSVSLRPSDLPPNFFLRPSHRARVAARELRRPRGLDPWRVVGVTPAAHRLPLFGVTFNGHRRAMVLDGDILSGLRPESAD